jgi:hypothetical protein
VLRQLPAAEHQSQGIHDRWAGREKDWAGKGTGREKDWAGKGTGREKDWVGGLTAAVEDEEDLYTAFGRRPEDGALAAGIKK